MFLYGHLTLMESKAARDNIYNAFFKCSLQENINRTRKERNKERKRKQERKKERKK